LRWILKNWKNSEHESNKFVKVYPNSSMGEMTMKTMNQECRKIVIL